MKVIKTERGYPGHFIGASRCQFRRNTLLECGDTRIVVSTVGPMLDKHSGNFIEIGVNRYYETMAFEAVFESPYWEADVSKEIDFESKWSIGAISRNSDKLADEMHEGVVAELSSKLEQAV